MVRVATVEEAARKAADGERVVVTVDGKDVALMPLVDLELFEELEDRMDNEAADRALAEPGPNIPFGDFLKEMERERAARRGPVRKQAKAAR
jgi:hypothetical protein